MEDIGITPIIHPIRGGTDGARLSFMGLPCPNIFIFLQAALTSMGVLSASLSVLSIKARNYCSESSKIW